MEIWKDIPGYEGLYQVSNYGRVKSLFRYKKILIPYTQPNEYQAVQLYKSKKSAFKLIHRLVAMAFLPNPDCKPDVNHKDECKTNNRLTNLEWVTAKENSNYGTSMLRMAKKQGKELCQLDQDGKVIDTFYSGGDAQRKTGVSRYKISLVAHGKRHTAGGYSWKFKEVVRDVSTT
ncbi:NUMOD4 domain-containing protein [Lactiplantibacillus plantarum]|uniref:NUMOD4 domain-containing protein n=1 Tax=Lactiplantibacillus plantarum TaxID=1590 RepID=UPI001C5623A7|nr:NUMOD4 domain-containing protein [Lactiplantibacillus plantarum]MBW1620086.1 hypothetical protein [Lactiplantibacillus plantarum]